MANVDNLRRKTLIEKLEKLSNKKVVLVEGVFKSVGNLKAGDVIQIHSRRGLEKIILMTQPSWGRSKASVEVVRYGSKEQYIKGEVQGYLTLALRVGEDYEVVGTIPPKEFEAIKVGHQAIRQVVQDKRSERTDTIHKAIEYNWDERTQTLTLKNGDKVKAGDKVRVEFTNGVFTMVLGNERGLVGNFNQHSNKVGMVFITRERGGKARSVNYDHILGKTKVNESVIKEEVKTNINKDFVLKLDTEDPFFAAVAIVFKGNKVLLGKSLSEDDRFGKLVFPGGHIDKDESPYMAAKRECKEETGLAVKCRPLPIIEDVPERKIEGKGDRK